MSQPEHHRISSYIRSQIWATRPEDLELIRAIAEGQGNPEALLARAGERQHGTRTLQRFGPVALVDLRGPIFKYANLMTEVSGATSLQRLAQDISTVIDDASVKHMVIAVDSGGGEANGTHELGELIYRARSEKNVVAYVSGIAASGGYWLASACSEIVADRTASVGSIGVVMEYWDDRKVREDAGYQRVQIVSDVSPNKRSDPLSDPGRAECQRMVDEFGAIFIETVARNRGVTEEHARTKFGRGGMLFAEAAAAAGMIDRIGDLQSLIAELQAAPTTTETRMSTEHTEPMTASQIRSEHRDAAGEIERAGEAGERKRITECVNVLERAGCLSVDASLKERLFDGVTTGGELAMEIIGQQEKYKQAQISALRSDALETERIGAESISDADLYGDNRVASIATSIAAQANAHNRARTKEQAA